MIGGALLVALLAAGPAQGAAAPAASTPEERYLDACEKYRAQDFEGARAAFEALAADGFECGEAFYGLGNAEYRLGRLGGAIASYRRAEDFLPREEDLEANLRIVRSRRQDRAEDRGGPSFLRALLFPHTRMTVGEETALALGLWLGGMALLHAALFVRRPALRRGGIALVALAVATGGSIGLRVRARASSPPGVVVVPESTVRTGPGDEYPAHFAVHDGLECAVLERAQDSAGRPWLKIAVEGDKRGFLPAADARVLPPLGI